MAWFWRWRSCPRGPSDALDAVAAQNANLSGTTNPVTVTLTIGDDTGTTSVNAKIRGSEILGSD
jgi:hypothetical protein